MDEPLFALPKLHGTGLLTDCSRALSTSRLSPTLAENAPCVSVVVDGKD